MAKIMIVDDASIMRKVMKDILMRHCGFEEEDIVEADGGKQALFKYRDEEPQLVLCDISMPDMNGIDVVRALMKADADANIVMCTASGDIENVRECVRLGAKDYIVKPPQPERVKQAITKVLGITFDEDEEESEKTEEGEKAEKGGKKAENSEDVKVLHDEIKRLKEEIAKIKGQSN